MDSKRVLTELPFLALFCFFLVHPSIGLSAALFKELNFSLTLVNPCTQKGETRKEPPFYFLRQEQSPSRSYSPFLHCK